MQKPEPGRRRNIWLPDSLYALMVKAAAKETTRTGERVTVSEWLRRAVRAALGR